ncbi:hypothetical protein KKH59_00575, partial [Patescibacteria group bacterium]|nr:hypothetical protein [Patescibacteria group bacterium]
PLSIVFALEVDWPPSPMGTDLTDSSTLTNLTQYLYEWGIAFGGLAAFIALLIAGFMYLTSVGDPQKMADARGRIIWALAGLVLLLAAWLVLNTINPDLTALSPLNLNPEGIPNFLCDDKCAKYKDNNQCTNDADCAWNPLAKYCYNKKCEINNTTTTCQAVADCAWDSSNQYCYSKDGCTKGYVCAKDPYPGDGEKAGVCTPPPLNQEPPCDAAIVYEKTDWDPNTGLEIVTLPEYILPDEISTYSKWLVSAPPGSIEAIYDDKDLGALCYNASSTQAKCEAVTSTDPICDSDPKTGSPTSSTRGGKCCVWTKNVKHTITKDIFGTPLPNDCYRACKGSACGCSVQVYVGAWLPAVTCGDMQSVIPAYERNLKNTIPGNDAINCLRLIRPFSY